MFHTYVIAKSGSKVDFDRATFVMDKALLDDAIAAMKAAVATPPEPFDIVVAKRFGLPAEPEWTTERKAQLVWDIYAGRHFDKYKETFRPDTDPEWDR